MTIWWLVLVLTVILAGGSAFIWIATKIHGSMRPAGKSLSESLQDSAEEDVGHIFNEEFRNELRNRGRLHFEKILGENAMFLQQDLQLTTSQLNEHMKTEINRELQEAFKNYEQAITDARQQAVLSIEQTKAVIDEERKALVAQLSLEVADEKARRIKQFDQHMAQVVNHYIIAAIGNQIDLSDQLDYIVGELEANKDAIMKDVHSGT